MYIIKVLETIFNDYFMKHLENNFLSSGHQNGFQSARSTGDLLSYVTSMWSSTLRDFSESFVVALDISKAFDRVKGALNTQIFEPIFVQTVSLIG